MPGWERSALNYNGYRPNDGAPNWFEYAAVQRGPDFNSANLVTRLYPALAAYQAGTGQDKHSAPTDWNVFTNATPPSPVNYPAIYDPSQVDLTLRSGSEAVDAGKVIPNVTDGLTGKAPDLGAYEFGQPAPHYGPRS